ncbi:MAG: non-homologous end-joining DNA ligase [Opitutales bacterium]
MKADDVKISHPDKVLFPDCGLTKQDLADYYKRVAERMLPYLKDRPLTLRCYPEGIDHNGFFNKNAPDHFPDFIRRIEVPARDPGRKAVTMSSADKPADLIYFTGQNTIEIHAALSTAGSLEKPDQIIFDFDPSDGNFDKVREAALAFGQLLDSLEIRGFWKTTGSRGLHAHLPIKPEHPFKAVKDWARNLARRLVEDHPALTTLEQRKDQRGDKVFIDILRNAYGQTAVAPYSVRARPGAPVATPVKLEEIKDRSFRPDDYTVKNIFRRLGQIEDPWKEFNHQRLNLDSHGH